MNGQSKQDGLRGRSGRKAFRACRIFTRFGFRSKMRKLKDPHRFEVFVINRVII
ncbi:MAG: hypothetical protein AB1458_14885 [Bacteroidota bacterium]